jgi:hypothetical protein
MILLAGVLPATDTGKQFSTSGARLRRLRLSHQPLADRRRRDKKRLVGAGSRC